MRRLIDAPIVSSTSSALGGIAIAASLLVNVALCQSSTRNPVIGSDTRAPIVGSATRTPAAGSDTRMPATVRSVGLRGFCPVCIVEMKQWMKGNPQISVDYDGKVYYFPGEDQRQMFLADPAKYVPALGGDCTVCYANMKQRMPGNVMHTALWRKRLFLFPGKDQQAEFLANPRKYQDVDLALGGKCAVCLVEMNQEVAGKEEFAAYFQGMRYLFPGAEQRQTFLASPAKYASQATPGNAQLELHEEASIAMVSVTGKSGCAGLSPGAQIEPTLGA